MKRTWAFGYLLLFVAFLTSTSFNMGLYSKLSKSDITTEDLCSVPEEQEEKPGSKDKELFHITESAVAGYKLMNRLFALWHKFPVPESIYLEVPHSPPNFR